MRVDQLLTTCSVLGGYYNREASDNMRNPELIRGENAKKRDVEEGSARQVVRGNVLLGRFIFFRQSKCPVLFGEMSAYSSETEIQIKNIDRPPASF